MPLLFQDAKHLTFIGQTHLGWFHILVLHIRVHLALSPSLALPPLNGLGIFFSFIRTITLPLFLEINFIIIIIIILIITFSPITIAIINMYLLNISGFMPFFLPSFLPSFYKMPNSIWHPSLGSSCTMPFIAIVTISLILLGWGLQIFFSHKHNHFIITIIIIIIIIIIKCYHHHYYHYHHYHA